MSAATILRGDVLERLAELPASSFDACLTDPPYGIGFMGKAWDGKAIEDAASKHWDRRASPSGRNKTSHGGRAAYAGSYDRSLKGNEAFQFWCESWAREVLRVLKPGGMMLAFGGTRTHHRLMVAIEDAGFEIRDCLMWLYGSGFPKSLDISKGIDRRRDDYEARCKVALWLRPYVEKTGFEAVSVAFGFKDQTMSRARWTSKSQPNTPTLGQWAKLKELCGFPDDMDAEVWRLNGRKGKPGDDWAKREKVGEREVPVGHAFAGPTYGGDSSLQEVDITAPATPAAQQWQGYGTALKPAWEPIILAMKPLDGTFAANALKWGVAGLNVDGGRIGTDDTRRSNRGGTGNPDMWRTGNAGDFQSGSDAGRWPANVLLDEDSAAMLDQQAGRLTSGGTPPTRPRDNGAFAGEESPEGIGSSMGGASRFYYIAKAGMTERSGSTHPTHKPVDLTAYLAKLILPPERDTPRRLLVPFSGSGSEIMGAFRAGWDEATGIELEDDYVEIAERRIVGDAPLFNSVEVNA